LKLKAKKFYLWKVIFRTRNWSRPF
jgi:hypothetical protein